MAKTAQPPLSINEEQLVFGFEHSLTITQFAALEQILGDLVAAGADARSRNAVRTAFFGIESFRTKLEFADRYVQLLVKDSPDLLERWRIVLKACNKANIGRNHVVHYTKIVHTQEKAGRRVVLVPHPTNPSRRRATATTPEQPGAAPDDSIGVRQLVEIRYTIFAAYMAVHSFRAVASGAADIFATVKPPQAPTLAVITTNYRQLATMAAVQGALS